MGLKTVFVVIIVVAVLMAFGLLGGLRRRMNKAAAKLHGASAEPEPAPPAPVTTAQPAPPVAYNNAPPPAQPAAYGYPSPPQPTYQQGGPEQMYPSGNPEQYPSGNSAQPMGMPMAPAVQSYPTGSVPAPYPPKVGGPASYPQNGPAYPPATGPQYQNNGYPPASGPAPYPGVMTTQPQQGGQAPGAYGY
ncbi:hypothetical protein AMAG_07181 [Allomyces macrogynus ATCC 38327]|uniref:Uncharacterized protein n=1 Tax=Allomyces macrogynus (strain ATCC 38327) TaxID=578462 RepID=A0A0L0SHI0_ALLM3|nr:hypothetical protein AMAG_07181 [Allomyces macrogynus ATCC 38327]|eukprot:KNE61912.1 hypothetical protein AMAG_07181 [Allomyces macrogynus ATCC 38327]